MPYFLRYAWGLPQILHLLYSLVEYFCSFCCFKIIDFLAITYPFLPALASERSAHKSEELTCFFIGLGSRYDYDIHTSDLVDLIVLDLRENDLFLDTDIVVTSSVEAVRVNTAEVSNSRKCNVDEVCSQVNPNAEDNRKQNRPKESKL